MVSWSVEPSGRHRGEAEPVDQTFLYLITNWHVVTGINPETGIFIGSFVPNAIRVYFFAEAPEDKEKSHGRHYMASASYTFDLDPSDPITGWLTHPKGKTTDIAAFSVEWNPVSEFHPVCLNLTEISTRLEAEVGDEVFVVGYPEGTSFERRLPLWKRGTVATDVDLDQLGRPQYFIDTIGNSGLSGSPVLQKRNMSFIGDDEGRVSSSYSFAGIYAGRLGQNGLKSQVGRVIKPAALFEMLHEAPEDQ